MNRIPRIRCAIVLSGDGLLLGRSMDMLRDDAEHLSAVASSVHSLTRGARPAETEVVGVRCGQRVKGGGAVGGESQGSQVDHAARALTLRQRGRE
ncbi:roadblock/LC7 domain-containing protein [Streptomyces sp. NPDC046985]|uniref:roadblock/LC7 domain-containing protein n=1 Tax=Streptomyces sp. NPDC046985 TaxID=3155377 RepID=UPI0033FB44BC